MRDKFWILLLVVIAANLLFRIWGYRHEYLTKYDPVYWREKYLRSQWVDPQSKEPIGDDGLFAYAAWEYIRGADPSLINAETPPLGKYLIGVSILLFQNQAVFALVVGILTLFIFYKLNLFLFKDKFWALAPVVFFSFEPLFYTQLRAPFLDTLYLLFLFATFYFLLKEKFLISAIFLGLMAATKNTISTFILISGTAGLYLLLFKKKNLLLLFLTTLLVSLLVLFLTYARYFWLGHSLRDFLALQKWILNFYAIGARGTLGMVFLMFFNHWQTWWNGAVKIAEWQISWPILLVFSICYLVLSTLRWRFDEFSLIIVWLVVYFIFLCFVPVWPRYLLLVLPFMYIIATFLFKSFYEKNIAQA